MVFFERDVPYYARHRDLTELPGLQLYLYAGWEEALPLAHRHLADADVAMVTSYCPDGIAAADLVLSSPAPLRVFYDMDTPVTLTRLGAGERVDYLSPRGLGDFDLVLSFTGRVALEELKTRLGARRVAPLYGSVDPEVHRPVPAVDAYRADLSYLGTYAEDRQPTLNALFIEAARRLPRHCFMIGGAGGRQVSAGRPLYALQDGPLSREVRGMWGIVPAAGTGSRIQPLAFSKELLPVGSSLDGNRERPRAVSEYLIERLIVGGVRKLCFVIAASKADILQYYGGSIGSVPICYVVQPRPAGLCDAIFRALPLVHPQEPIAVGLPDTIWFPSDALTAVDGRVLSFLLFPVERPELFDAVIADADGRVREIQVKHPGAASSWVWGAFKMPGAVLHELFDLWCARDRRDEYIGTLVNAYLERGGEARGAGREGVCRRRHVAWLPRGHPTAGRRAPRPEARGGGRSRPDAVYRTGPL